MVWDHIPQKEARQMEAVWAIQDARQREKEASQREARSTPVEALTVQGGSTEITTAVDPNPKPFDGMSSEEMLAEIRKTVALFDEIGPPPPPELKVQVDMKIRPSKTVNFGLPYMGTLGGVSSEREQSASTYREAMAEMYSDVFGEQMSESLRDLFLSLAVPPEILQPSQPYSLSQTALDILSKSLIP